MIEKKNEVSYLVSAEVFRGELWSECTPHGSMRGTLSGVVQGLFRRLAKTDHAKSQELLKILMDIQYSVGSD